MNKEYEECIRTRKQTAPENSHMSSLRHLIELSKRSNYDISITSRGVTLYGDNGEEISGDIETMADIIQRQIELEQTIKGSNNK